MGADLFHWDRRTAMTKLIVTFRNFVKAPKKTFHNKHKIVRAELILLIRTYMLNLILVL